MTKKYEIFFDKNNFPNEFSFDGDNLLFLCFPSKTKIKKQKINFVKVWETFEKKKYISIFFPKKEYVYELKDDCFLYLILKERDDEF